MNVMLVFLSGLALTAAMILGALLYLRNPLYAILADLCGTAPRARFWTAFSNVTLFLLPLAVALGNQPAPGSAQPVVFAIADQIKSALLSLFFGVVILGMVLSMPIARRAQPPAGERAVE
jgi:hypothetical protein